MTCRAASGPAYAKKRTSGFRFPGLKPASLENTHLGRSRSLASGYQAYGFDH